MTDNAAKPANMLVVAHEGNLQQLATANVSHTL